MNHIILTTTGGDSISNLGQTILNLVLWIQPIAPYLLIVGIVIIAACLFSTSQTLHQKIPKICLSLLLGYFLLFTAIEIAEELQSKMVF